MASTAMPSAPTLPPAAPATHARTIDMTHDEFLALFLTCEVDLAAFVVSVVRDWNRAEDIVQEVALVLWRKIDEFDRARSFGAWARGIAEKEIMKDHGRWLRRPRSLPPEAISAVRAACDELEPRADERLEAMQRCLEHLDHRARQLVDLRYADDLPLADVAARTGRSLAAVTKSLLRLREALERCVSLHLGGASDGGPA
jgi:RNA polymerase sigma-70 factor, ECF subfamily